MNGTTALVRLAWRRDRVLLPAWIVGLSGMVVFSVAATKDLYPTRQTLVTAAEAVNATAALVAWYGRVYDPTSLGAVSLIKMTAFGAAVVAILFVFIAIRHTRAEEESGRLELVGAGAVGRAVPLTAALVVGMASSVVLGAVTTLGLVLVGLPASGAVSFGLAWAMSGVVFTAVGVVVAQLTTSARAAVGLGMVCVGVAYLLRALGDLGAGDPGWLSWLSPIGWSQQIRPFAGDRWWVAGLPIAASALLVALAFALRSRRDLGSGMLADRPGPATGDITGVVGLAFRLQRGVLAAWVVGFAVMGLLLGSIVHSLGSFDSPQMRKFIVLLGGEKALIDAFLALEMGIIGILVAAYAVAATSRLRSEEVGGHTEMILATTVSRTRWAASHFGLALVGVVVILLVTGLSVGIGDGLTGHDVGHEVARMVMAAAAQIPAAWVMASVVMALFGWTPHWVAGAWGLLVGFLVIAEFGRLWQLPAWLLDVSPFEHSPQLPGGTVGVGQIGLLLAVAAALALVGFGRWRVRDTPA